MSREFKVLLLLLLFGIAWFAFRPTKERALTTETSSRVSHKTGGQEELAGNREIGPDDAGARPFNRGSFEEGAQEEESGEGEDSEIIQEGSLARQFVFSTPPPVAGGGASSSGPIATVVSPKGSDSPTPGASRRALDNDGGVAQVRDPGIEALEELNRLAGSRHSSLIGGVRVRGNSGSVQTGEKEETETGEEEEEDSEVLPRLGGQARGYTILALMHPNARESVEKQVEIMIRSQVRNLYVGFLVDGTFSTDFDYASTVVQRLSADGRTLKLELYFTNGPTMRHFQTTPIITAFSRIDPGLFRSALLGGSPQLAADLRQIVEEAKPLFVQNRNAGPENRNLACVMLEDNLDVASYGKMRAIVKPVLGDIAAFIRNPCPGCFSGNDSDPDGDAYEGHSPEQISQLGSSDGLSFDGWGYNYPGESKGGTLSIEQMKRYAEQAAARKIGFFALWRADRQGLGDQSIHPDDRVYAVPTETQAEFDIEILRTGLEQE